MANPLGELHDTPGVWVGDASAFPTASGVNPMLTIMARARRTAGAIAGGHHSRLFAPRPAVRGAPDFPFEPHYREVDGLRLAHIDEGAGEPVVFFHGEPTWSYLWRKVIPPLLDAGYRCIAPDYAGFGRSDKPTDLDWYTYDRHSSCSPTLLEDLDVRDATVVVHDWGGPIGLRLAAEQPDRIARMVIMDTGLFTGEQPMSDAWKAFRDFVERTEDLPVSMLVEERCAPGADDATSVRRLRRRPFPTPESKAGARAFPLMLPTTPDMPAPPPASACPEALRTDERPCSCSGPTRTRSSPSRSGSASRTGSTPTRPRRSRTHRTSSRRTRVS